jgi:hypothetical protein
MLQRSMLCYVPVRFTTSIWSWLKSVNMNSLHCKSVKLTVQICRPQCLRLVNLKNSKIIMNVVKSSVVKSPL